MLRTGRGKAIYRRRKVNSGKRSAKEGCNIYKERSGDEWTRPSFWKFFVALSMAEQQPGLGKTKSDEHQAKGYTEDSQ
jgi:hypothetical protein